MPLAWADAERERGVDPQPGRSMMRIIYLHQYFNTPAMSGITRSYELGRRLVRMGHEVHVITTQRDEGHDDRGWRRTEAAGMHVHWCPVPYSNHMAFKDRIRAFAKFALLAGPKAAGLRGDVLFATSPPLT